MNTNLNQAAAADTTTAAAAAAPATPGAIANAASAVKTAGIRVGLKAVDLGYKYGKTAAIIGATVAVGYLAEKKFGAGTKAMHVGATGLDKIGGLFRRSAVAVDQVAAQ